jgi:hypothetical protein
MESGIQSSFIPKDASAPTPVPRRAESGGLAEVLFLISIVLLVASAALAGAVFLYSQYVQSSSASKVTQLQRAKTAFDPALIQELTRLDDRMRAADTVLTGHIAPTAFFDALQQTTLTTIAFQSLSFLATDAQHMTIKLTGIAQGVNSIALEGDLFSKSGVIANPIFSDISRQADGVHFTLAATVNPAAINYVQLLSGASQAAAASQVQTQTPTAGGTDSIFGEPSQTQTQTQTQTQVQTQTGGADPVQGVPQLPTN